MLLTLEFLAATFDDDVVDLITIITTTNPIPSIPLGTYLYGGLSDGGYLEHIDGRSNGH